MTMNLFNPSTTPGVANIILLVIAVVLFLITLCLALIILKHHYKCTNNQPRSIEYPKNNDTTQVSDQPNQHSDTTPISDQPNQHPDTPPRCDQPNQHPDTTPRPDPPNQHPDTTPRSDQPNQLPESVLQIYVGGQPFGIPKNDVPLTDLLAKFNLIISSTADHITLNDQTKLTIKELQKLITDWEIKALKDAIVPDCIVTDSIVPDSTSQCELKWFASVLPALNELMKSNE